MKCSFEAATHGKAEGHTATNFQEYVPQGSLQCSRWWPSAKLRIPCTHWCRITCLFAATPVCQICWAHRPKRNRMKPTVFMMFMPKRCLPPDCHNMKTKPQQTCGSDRNTKILLLTPVPAPTRARAPPRRLSALAKKRTTTCWCSAGNEGIHRRVPAKEATNG